MIDSDTLKKVEQARALLSEVCQELEEQGASLAPYSGWADPRCAMRRPQEWEYKVEPVFNPHRTEAVLNSLAEEGWRLVAVTHPGPEGQFKDPAGTAWGPWLFLERRVIRDYAGD